MLRDCFIVAVRHWGISPNEFWHSMGLEDFYQLAAVDKKPTKFTEEEVRELRAFEERALRKHGKWQEAK